MPCDDMLGNRIETIARELWPEVTRGIARVDSVTGLELQPQRKHDLPLQCRTTEGCIENASAALTIHAVEGKVKVHLVEDIEDVCPKLNRGIFS
jgi:hypothetical protein